MAEVRNLNAELRAKRVAKKECSHPHWIEGKRYDKCSLCNTTFPCRGECTHLDCSEARIERGMDFDYQDGCHEFAVMYMNEAGRILFEAEDR